MASLARACGQTHLLLAARAKALATVLDRLDKSPEDDAPFIIDTVIGFLETLHCPRNQRMPAAMA
jgi:hypothetical protein